MVADLGLSFGLCLDNAMDSDHSSSSSPAGQIRRCAACACGKRISSSLKFDFPL